MEKIPNFFIVGAPKSGTTSLHEYLKEVPEIYMSPLKEPNFFSITNIKADDDIINPIRDKKQYLDLFTGVKNETIIGESTAHYLQVNQLFGIWDLGFRYS